MRFFNTTGPCNPTDHYMLPALSRLDASDLDRLIQQKSYFILYAPRQTGKTMAMLALACQLTNSGTHIGVMVSMEVGQAFPDDIGWAEDAILANWRRTIRFQLPKELYPPVVWKTDAPAGQRIGDFLAEWALDTTRPLVVLIDKIDALQDQVLITL